MAHGLDDVETGQAAALPRRAVDRILAFVNDLVVKAASAALVAAGFVLTYSVIVRYFLKISTDWQDETSVFLIIGAVFLSSAAVQAMRGHVAIETIVGLLSPRVARSWSTSQVWPAARSSPGNPGRSCMKHGSTAIIRGRPGARRCGSPTPS
jgi:Tripartite ATP-independent periplasmic transporters, DctQ component